MFFCCSIYIGDSPKLPWGMQGICGPFILEFIREILSSSMFFCCSICIETAQNSRVECNEFANLLFWRLSLCLSRDSLSCDTRSLDLSILFKFIFLYLFIHSTPFLHFSHILLYTIFFFRTYITTRNIFLIPDDGVARNLIIVYNFSSQRPRLKNLFLYNVYSFDTELNFPWNTSTNLLIFTNKLKASSHVVIA